MSKLIQIVVTCTKRKTRALIPELMVRSLPRGSVEKRAQTWIDRLSCTRVEKLAVENLYSGDHWQVVLSLEQAAASSGYRIQTWVCSAGYGLLTPASRVVPYSATFSRTHPDSVCQEIKKMSPLEAPQCWWRLLAAWHGPTPGMPRRIAEIAGEHSRSPTWIIASEIYLQAIARDIKELASALRDPDRLSIFSAGTESSDGLTDHLIPADARMQPLVGGARRSLNVRLARKALLELGRTGPDLAGLKEKFSRLLARQPRLVGLNRTHMTDEELKRYIKKAVKEDPNIPFTPLLRRLRDSGFACEHSRFASLYHQIQEQLHET
jgi:hypothetical protein